MLSCYIAEMIRCIHERARASSNHHVDFTVQEIMYKVSASVERKKDSMSINLDGRHPKPRISTISDVDDIKHTTISNSTPVAFANKPCDSESNEGTAFS